MHRHFRNLMAVLICAALARPSRGHSAVTPQADPLPPSDAQFRVTTKANQTRFYLGERIPIELSFTSSTPQRYQATLARYDRSGRMNYEEFRVTPGTGWTDPLRSYFLSLWGWMGGGLASFAFLSEKPTTLPLDLNEWIQFSAPGRYKIVVHSSRIHEVNRENPAPFGNAQSVTSNELEITIVPAPKDWQAATLQKALAIIDAPRKTPIGQSSEADQEAWRSAVKTLRYLDTTASARELARHLRGDDNGFDFDCLFGLVESPNRDAALAEMLRLCPTPIIPSPIFSSALCPFFPCVPTELLM
jgi:hypothetical protein